MVCDLHAYVEYREIIESHQYSETWRPLGGHLHLTRNYEVFGRMGNDSREDIKIMPAKGIPQDLGYQADGDWWLYINKKEGDSCTTLEKAKRYEKMGSKVQLNAQGEIERVEHPDWHSPTWLTSSELKKVLKGLTYVHEYQAVLAMMKSLESNGKEVRLVVWFDN